MRTFFGVVGGFCLTSLLILTGEWGYTLIATPGLQTAQTAAGLLIALLSLIYIGITVVTGGYLSAMIDDSPEATAAYSVIQLFFGAWFFREFWTTGFVWYKPAALFLVIPCAFAGRSLARRSAKTSGASKPSTITGTNYPR